MEETSKSPISYYPTLPQGFGIVLMFIFLSLFTGLIMASGNFGGNKIVGDFLELLGYVVAAGGTLLATITIKRKVYGNQPAFINYRVTPADYILVLLLTVMIIIVIDPLTSVIPMPDKYKELFETMFSKTFPAFLTAVIAAPLLEELIFRGIVLEGFLKNYSPAKAILWTNILFGLAHLNPWQFLGAFLMGIFISWVYYKTRNLILPVFIHFINNLISYFFLYYSDKPVAETSLADFFSGSSGYLTLILACLILLSLFFLFSNRIFPINQYNPNKPGKE
jgi:hypothetical protein